ncbi:diguanylate cyclase [Tychonema sp. BBK16]|uniref:diguanylate cyclase n=1 Tax=Tychonema sp. BBK16 TaxID=2699888 RepID=UPI001F2BAE61|nr:diguanylate cyclase [Tychonema sp. BBK16]MCF6372953.1 diguanylate cyclase [Tychonema sp. BBK16]
MSDCEKTKEQLIDELEALRAEVAALKSVRSPHQYSKLIVDDSDGDRQIFLPELLNTLQQLVYEQTSYLSHINAQLHQEITERKLLEAKLAYSENKIRAILEAMTDVILIVNLEGDALGSIDMAPINNRSIDALRSEIVNQTINRFFQEPLNSDWLQRVREVVTSGKTAQFDYSLSVGSYLLWFSAIISPITGTAVSWVARDISDRKLAEAKLQQLNTELEQRILERTIALRQSEAHLQEAQRFARLGSWEFDVFTNKVIWSPEIFQIYGLDPKEPDPTPEQVLQKFPPEDRERLENSVKNAIRCGQPYALDLKIIRADGAFGYIFAKGEAIYNAVGQVVRVVGIVIDISERKEAEIMLEEAEKRWRFVFDNVQLVVVELDIIGVINYVNPFLLKLTDHTESEILGESWIETFVPPADWEEMETMFSKILASQNHSYCENQILTKSGTERFIVWNNTLLINSAGNPTGIFSIGEDITDRKVVEEALQRVNQELQELVAELKEKNAEMLLLNGISDYLQSCFTVAEACATIATLSQPLFPESCGAIFLMTNSRDILEMVTSWGDRLCSETIFHPKDCWALRRGRRHWIGSEEHDLFCNHIDHQNPPAESLCIPMIAQGETIGLLYLCASKPDKLTENRQQIARRVAEQLGLAIANITLREKLLNQSIRDPLTGLFNRRYLEEFITKEIARAERNQYSVGMIMIDLDHFKRFNNTLGHDAGDLVLKEIGKLLNSMIRASDVACRYGGEEMTLILPEASLEGTYQKAEEVRKAIEQMQLNYQGKMMESITASMGVACYPDRGTTGCAVIQAADAALYRAKAAGRNQVIVA